MNSVRKKLRKLMKGGIMKIKVEQVIDVEKYEFRKLSDGRLVNFGGWSLPF